jgi:hypothetical protein
MTQHQISVQDFSEFQAATMLASAGTKRLWMVTNPLDKAMHFVICDRNRGDLLEVKSGSNVLYDFHAAIDLYNSIR